MGRYRTEPEDLVKKLERLETRLATLERMPRLIATTIDGGELVFKNSDVGIVVEDSSGRRIITIVHSATGPNPDIPIISLFPAGDDTAIRGELWAADFGDDTVLEYSLTEPLVTYGGKFYAAGSVAILSHAPNGGGNEAYIQFLPLSAFNGSFYAIGTWENNVQHGTTDAVSCGSTTVGGVSSLTITYTQTYASTIVPIVGFHSSSGAVNWCLTAQSTSAFTVAWTGTTTKIINWWSIRL